MLLWEEFLWVEFMPFPGTFLSKLKFKNSDFPIGKSLPLPKVPREVADKALVRAYLLCLNPRMALSGTIDSMPAYR